ncbi:MAG: thrombospondin type 3 repeat-containing protein, partial [Myxococcota bacterium]
DGDALGDACDLDDDNDTVPDLTDNCPLVANATQTNTDGDALGDACDLDDDNDAVPDLTDNCPLVANASQTNFDGDSLGDACDPDDDNDLTADGSDCKPFNPAVHPGALETTAAGTCADALDNDCDTLTDLQDPGCACVAGNTGFLVPTAESADSGGDSDGFELSPTNAFANGSVYASNINGPDDRHRYFNYGIAIPAGCKVKGIEVEVDWWLDSMAGTSSLDVALSGNAGSSFTAVKTDATESTIEHQATLGSSTNLWNTAWNASKLADGNFRVRLTSKSTNSGRDFYLDWVPVRVSYGP